MKLTCPSKNRLREFLEGSVSDVDADQISDHVEGCSGCDLVLATLESEQSDVLKELRERVRTESLLQEPELERLRNTAPFGHADTTILPHIVEQPESGKRLRDYRLVKKIGEGGMGTVYQAVHVHLAKHVAVKILPADKLRSRQAVSRFRQEMRAVGKVNHPNVVSASDAGTVDGQHFLVMELVQGADLARIIHERGPLSVADACEIVRQTAMGLQHAHDSGLVHRDVKPSNVMLSLDGSVKLLDLGLAGLNKTDFESTANVVVTERLTAVGQIMGTLDYMAPEQVTASPQADGKADVYALGATLFQLLTGRTPCGDRSQGTPERIEAVLHNPPLDIATLRDDVPAELSALLLKMLAKNPEDRPQAAIDVAAELKRFTSDADLVALAEACRTSLDMPSADVDVTDDVSFVVSRTAPCKDYVNSRRPFTAVALASFLLALVAAIVCYIQTNNGVVRVQVFDDSFKVVINDQSVTVQEGNNLPIKLRPGEHKLVVWVGENELLTDHFEIRRNGQIAFKVERLAGEVVVSKDGERFGAKLLPNGEKTQQILDRMVQAYAECKSYRDSGVVKTVFIENTVAPKRTVEQSFTTVFVRPDRFRFELNDKNHRYLISANGQNVKTWWDVEPGIQEPASLQLAIAGAFGVSGGSAGRIPSLLMPQELDVFGGLQISDVKQIDDGTLQSVECYRLEGKYVGAPITLWIDKQSYLVRRIDEQNELDGFRTEQTTTFDPIMDGQISDQMLEFDPPGPDEKGKAGDKPGERVGRWRY